MRASAALGVVFISAQAFAQDDSQAVRAHFTSRAAPQTIRAAACSLRPLSTVGEQPRSFDVRFGNRRCVSTPLSDGSIALIVRTEQRDDSQRDVILEVELPSDVPLEELQEAVEDSRLELENRLTLAMAAPPPPAVVVTEQAPPKRKWYGAVTLGIDGLAAASCLTIILCPFVGLGGFVFGAPILHWVHGNVGKGFGSLGIRLALPAAAAGIGAAIGAGADQAARSGTSGATTAAVIGFLSGVVGASLLDALVLAYDDPPEPKQNVRILPVFAPAASGATFGVLGAF